MTRGFESSGSKKKKTIKIIVATIVALAVIAAIVIPIVIIYTSTEEEKLQDLGDRISCFPLDTEIDSIDCTTKGCLWDPEGVYVKCFLPGIESYGYKIAKEREITATGWKIGLERIVSTSLYGGDYDQVVLEVIFYDNAFRFMLYPTDADVESLRPPVPLPTMPSSGNDPKYAVDVNDTVGAPFFLKVTRKSSNAIIFDTSIGGLTFAEQFLMISTKLPNKYLYGIGENPHESFVHDMNYKMWPIFARDQPPGDGAMNLYGSHPFYMVSEDDGSSHGVLFFNSHAIDVTTLPAPGLTYRTIGGMFDFFFFMGPKPEEVVQHYTQLIGRPMIPPYWALGFQICRYGYTSTADIKEVVERTREAGIPQDVQYADIDYMDEQAIFTFGDNFTDLPDYVSSIKNNGVHFILILNPFVNTEKPAYAAHENAMNKDVYIKWFNSTYQPPSDCSISPSNCQNLTDVMLGYVWPVGRAAFPDFFKNSTQEWWIEEVMQLHDEIEFDGLWIDMNEPANFDTNLDKPFNWPPERPNWNLICPKNKWDDPPYITLSANRSSSQRLSDKTICMIGKQGQNDEYLHYNIHNLYGWSHTEPTFRAVRQATGKRGVVISRSTFPSSGKWAGHWLGDNTSRWKDLYSSVIGMLEFNIFGIPYIGADICGYFQDTTEEMCQRWMELGAFYPFSRNHNTINTLSQDPAMWESVAEASRIALNHRYTLLPYLYTLFFHSHQLGNTVARPLYHEYPTDIKAKVVDRQFLWGPALLISPVLQQGQTNLSAYLPDDVWYDYYTGEAELNNGDVTWYTPLNKINLHIRGGFILPTQEPALNTMLSRKNNFGLIVALGENDAASGDLFWDDGEAQDSIENEAYQLLFFTYGNNSLKMAINVNGTNTLATLKMDTIRMLGVKQKPSGISSDEINITEEQITYDEATKVLNMKNLNLPMVENWEIAFTF